MSDSKQQSNIAVIGGGSWGTTLASLLCRNAKVTLWARDTAVVDEINQTHRHTRYLGDLPINKKLKATADIETALRDKLLAKPKQDADIDEMTATQEEPALEEA